MTNDAAQAVKRFLAEPDEDDTRLDPMAALRDELKSLWSDLRDAQSAAYYLTAERARWSMRCDWTVERIARLSLIVGPTPWSEIGIDLLESGLYQTIYDALGVEYEKPDMARVAEIRARIRAGQ